MRKSLKASNKKKFIGFIVETDVNANLDKISIPKDRIIKVKKDIRRALKAGEVSARFLACKAGQLISLTKQLYLQNFFSEMFTGC